MRKYIKGDKKLLNAWAFYDWANSVYPLVITSAVFPIFYESLFAEKEPYVFVFGHVFKDSALISFTSAAAFLAVSILSPLLSGISDYLGNKKFFMKFFCYMGAFSCIGLYWFSLENIYFGLFCYFFGVVGFWGSLVFYNSYLPDIAFPGQQDAISSKGYSFGYAGSVILLIINLAMIMRPDFFGIGESAEKAMRYSFIMVGLWWIIFSQYSYYYLPKGARKTTRKITSKIFFNGFLELKKVWYLIKCNEILKKYLLGFFVYSMAVQTVMLIATYFGKQEIAWESSAQSTIGLIICILLIQLIAIFGAYFTAKCSERYGNIPVLIVLNAFWAVLCSFAFFITLPLEFYIMAACVGLVMGGIQSLSRSTYSKLLPKSEDTASFFSFYDVSEKIGIVIGIMIYGLIDQITGSPRLGILFLASFFIIGIVLLIRVPSKKHINNN